MIVKIKTGLVTNIYIMKGEISNEKDSFSRYINNKFYNF